MSHAGGHSSREENRMIARIWRGITLATKAEQYLEYLNRIVIPVCQRAEGNKGLFVMKEPQGELMQFLLLTFWASHEALEKFAGADGEAVNPTPEEKSLLVAFESNARHYNVICAPEHLPPK